MKYASQITEMINAFSPAPLQWNGRFSAMESYFVTKTLPMIKIETIENLPFQDGINIIREIVKKRASMELFEADVLERMIQYTGGSLGDLFHVINASAKRAERRDSERISIRKTGKNFIFLVTPYWDDRLAVEAYDFYSFVKLRIIFPRYGMKRSIWR